jgi:membrane fusion protein (multidrug efflux system)
MEQPPRQDSQRPKGQNVRAEHQPPTADSETGEEPIESVPLYKNFKIVIPLFVVIIGMAILAYYWYIGSREYASTDDAYVDANRVAISAKILGRIDSLTANEGDTVQSGQILVMLDDSDLRSQQAQARTAMALAQESVVLANVSLEKAQTDYKRAMAQIKDNIITKEQFDHTQSEFESAKARVGIAHAQANSAKAQLNVIETQLKNTVILSPMSGVISKRWALAGDVVSPGQPIFTVYDLKNLWVTANMEETSISALHVGDNVEVNVDAYPETRFSGKVFQIGSNTASQFSLIPPNNASGNFTKITQRVPVKISIQPASGPTEKSSAQLLPGMSVEVKVKLKAK